jgi:hypothetical protein
MPEQPTSDATPSTPDASVTTTDAAGSTAPTTPTTPTTTAPAQGRSKGKRILAAAGAVAVALALKFGLAAVLADDPTHGVTAGQCVAADGSDDFKPVDCGSADSLGKVTFVATDAETSEKAALALCAAHGSDSAYTAADTTGGTGTVVCVTGR